MPLVVAAFPFVARLVESSLRELDPNIIEMAQSMGSSTWQIIFRVMLPESVPSLITNFTLAITTILGYTAMSGAMGGGGLGKIAINYGYSRYKYAVLYLAVIVLVLLVQVFQTVGTRLAARLDKRIKKIKQTREGPPHREPFPVRGLCLLPVTTRRGRGANSTWADGSSPCTGRPNNGGEGREAARTESRNQESDEALCSLLSACPDAEKRPASGFVLMQVLPFR